MDGQVANRFAEVTSTEFGEWVVRRRLGAGGMGVVHLATRGNRQAALKVLRPALVDDPIARERFQREILAGLKIRSPHVASIIDFDLEAPTPFVAWQFVDGPTLKHLVESRGPLDDDGLRQLGAGLAVGIEAMAAAGVCHRDLKPSNVLMSCSGPVIIDLGIAALEDDSTLTRTGQIVGSPFWMAPEQLTDQAHHTTSATDVFGWGAVLHFAASATPPYGTGSSTAVMYRAVQGRLQPHPIKGRLGVLVDRALALDVRGRPSPTELVDELNKPLDVIDLVADANASRAHDRTDHLVGRQAELDLLCRALSPMVPAAVWCIEGPAGVGKSRLLEEVASITRASGATVVVMGEVDAVEQDGAFAALEPGSLVVFDGADDLERLPGSTNDTIRQLLGRGVVLMGALRPVDAAAGQALLSLFGALDRRHLLRRLTLTPLATPDATKLYRTISGLHPPDDLIKRSGGNPLLICQLARDAEVHQAFGGRSDQLPLMALELLAELGDAGREVATIAACVGDRFRIADLGRIITNAAVLLDGFEECLRAKVLTESDDGHYGSFKYGVLRDQIVGGVCAARQRAVLAMVTTERSDAPALSAG